MNPVHLLHEGVAIPAEPPFESQYGQQKNFVDELAGLRVHDFMVSFPGRCVNFSNPHVHLVLGSFKVRLLGLLQVITEFLPASFDGS